MGQYQVPIQEIASIQLLSQDIEDMEAGQIGLVNAPIREISGPVNTTDSQALNATSTKHFKAQRKMLPTLDFFEFYNTKVNKQVSPAEIDIFLTTNDQGVIDNFLQKNTNGINVGKFPQADINNRGQNINLNAFALNDLKMAFRVIKFIDPQLGPYSIKTDPQCQEVIKKIHKL